MPWPTNRITTNPRRAFTLIELLMVVAIISILAAIAMPNFLDAQTRSKVTRVKADMRTIALGLEVYHIDNNGYPFRRNTKVRDYDYVDVECPAYQLPVPRLDNRLRQLSRLTTPIAYISSLPVDVFEQKVVFPNNVIDFWDSYQSSWMVNSRRMYAYHVQYRVCPEEIGWLLVSVGPDGFIGNYKGENGWPYSKPLYDTMHCVYDPTNGTISSGNIYWNRQGGGGNSDQRLTYYFTRAETDY